MLSVLWLAKLSLVLYDSPMPAGDPSGHRKLTRRNSRRSAELRRGWGTTRGSVQVTCTAAR